MLNKLERKLGRFAIPHLMLVLVGGQAAAFVLSMAKPEFVGLLVLVPERVMAGEVWRLITFLFIPPDAHPIFVIFALYLLFLYGRSLEEHWGEFRFNLFIFIGWIATIAAAFAVQDAQATNVFLMGSLLLAFAYLNPDFTILLMFILPVRIKWIGYLTGALYAYAAIRGDLATKMLVLAGVLNFFLFFGPDMIRRLRGASRRTTARSREKPAAAGKPLHQCAVCGITDTEDPNMQFRYCSQCDGKKGYCMDHIRDHEHAKPSA